MEFKLLFMNNNWQEMTVEISDIDKLLAEYEIEVDSPDGYVPITLFVDKGEHKEYVLQLFSGKEIRCNGQHLFETIEGWRSAEDLLNTSNLFLSDSENYELGRVYCTDNIIPIVDINVDHPNHRYYTNGISSHNTNVGKTIFGCHYAASCLKKGKNVLYISMEMAEEDIGNRIDANMMKMEVDSIRLLQKSSFLTRIDSIKEKTNGRLIIKQFPTGDAHVGHFKALVNELKIKSGFVPHIIIVDYLNICASRKFPKGHDNSNTLIKAVSEELRGMMVSLNCIGLTFTQFNREGMKHTDNELTDTADAIGATFTADSYFAMNEPEELAALNQIIFKQLKNRYGDKNVNKRFIVGLEKARMTFYNVESDSVSMPNIGNSVRNDKPKLDHTENKGIAQFKNKGFKFNN